MADIATLGIEVKTTGVEEATAELTKLSGAAARAEAAVDGLEVASQGATGAASSAAAGYTKQGAAAAAASKQVQLMTKAANDNKDSFKVSAADVENLAGMLKDVGVSAATSVSPLEIALDKGFEMAMMFGPMGAAGAVKTLGAAFNAIVNPLSLVTMGVVYAGASLVQLIDWAKLASSAIDTIGQVLQTIAPYAMVAAAALALIYAPALVGGVVSLIMLLGQLALSGLAIAANFTIAWAAALGPVGWLILAFAALVAVAIAFRDKLAGIFGRDIVQDAKDGINYLIAVFVGGFNGVKAAWGLLPSAISDVVYQTVNFTIKGVESMINKVIEGINFFVGRAYDSVSGIASKIGLDIGHYDGVKQVQLDLVHNPDAGKAAEAYAVIMKEIEAAKGTDYLGDMSAGVADGISTVTDKLKDLAKGFLKVDDAQKKSQTTAANTASVAAKQSDAYGDLVKDAEKRIASLEAEQAAVGLSAEAAAKLKYETEMLNQAQQKNIELTPQQRTELSALAARMASVEANTAAAKANLELAKSSATGFLSTLRQGLVNGEGWWKSFGNAALSVLDKIASAIETQLVNALFSTNGGGFNLFSFLTGTATAATGGGSVGGGAAASAKAAAGVARPAALRNAAPPARTVAQGQGVHVTIGLKKDGLNIAPEVVGVARSEAGRAAGAVKAGFETWRRNEQHRDIEKHIANRRVIGR
jgi:hypothetical protein